MGKMKKAGMVGFCLLVLLLCSAQVYAVGGQQVKIPYVISMPGSGWWTGIAITNNANEPITDMEILFFTNSGHSGYNIGGTKEIMEPIDPPEIPSIYIEYSTELDEIDAYAMLVNTLDGFYAGDSTKTLPTETGSIILSHSGSAQFSVTVYIGNPDGFAFQVFESTSPAL